MDLTYGGAGGKKRIKEAKPMGNNDIIALWID